MADEVKSGSTTRQAVEISAAEIDEAVGSW